MSKDLNKVILIARLTRDPELKYTPSGIAICSFSIASSNSYSHNGEKKEQVSYFDCVVWNKLAEIAVEYLKKGNRIAIDGRLIQRRWKNQDDKLNSKVEVVVENFQFLNNKKDDETNGNSTKKPASNTTTPPPDNSNGGLGEDMGNREDMFDEANPVTDEDLENLF